MGGGDLFRAAVKEKAVSSLNITLDPLSARRRRIDYERLPRNPTLTHVPLVSPCASLSGEGVGVKRERIGEGHSHKLDKWNF